MNKGFRALYVLASKPQADAPVENGAAINVTRDKMSGFDGCDILFCSLTVKNR